jgi:hypothetical protein
MATENSISNIADVVCDIITPEQFLIHMPFVVLAVNVLTVQKIQETRVITDDATLQVNFVCMLT